MKFPGLPAATALTGSEIVPLTQGGVDRRTTTQEIADLAAAGGGEVSSVNGEVPDSDGDVEVLAANVPYDPTVSGLSATEVQSAIDELESMIGGGGSGDVVGPASSTDNTIPRFDGTSGKTLQGSGVAVTDDNEISGYRGSINAQSGTSYTLAAGDTGKVVELTNAAGITLTLPNSLPPGFCCTIVQGGAGQVTTAAASGATRRNRQSHTKLAGQWAGATLYVRANSGGAAAEYVLAGDTAA